MCLFCAQFISRLVIDFEFHLGSFGHWWFCRKIYSGRVQISIFLCHGRCWVWKTGESTYICIYWCMFTSELEEILEMIVMDELQKITVSQFQQIRCCLNSSHSQVKTSLKELCLLNLLTQFSCHVSLIN